MPQRTRRPRQPAPLRGPAPGARRRTGAPRRAARLPRCGLRRAGRGRSRRPPRRARENRSREPSRGRGASRRRSRNGRPDRGRAGETSGFARDGGRISAFRTSSSTTRSESPWKSRCPVNISWRTEPSEKRSLRWSIGFPQACSGDMYWSFPLSDPLSVCETFRSAFAIPKSQSLISPSCEIRMFCGETSRCTMWSSCPFPSRRRCA